MCDVCCRTSGCDKLAGDSIIAGSKGSRSPAAMLQGRVASLVGAAGVALRRSDQCRTWKGWREVTVGAGPADPGSVSLRALATTNSGRHSEPDLPSPLPHQLSSPAPPRPVSFVPYPRGPLGQVPSAPGICNLDAPHYGLLGSDVTPSSGCIVIAGCSVFLGAFCGVITMVLSRLAVEVTRRALARSPAFC